MNWNTAIFQTSHSSVRSVPQGDTSAERKLKELIITAENTTKQCDVVYSVYVHVFPDGKKYVGLTRRKPEDRWRHGRGYKQERLSSAINEVGWDNISHNIVLKTTSVEEAKEMEKHLIAEYRTQDPDHGYNTKNGGQVFGEHSKEFIETLRSKMYGNTYGAGRKMSKEHIDAMRRGRARVGYKKTKPVSPETRAKLSAANKGKKRSALTIQRIKDSMHDMSGANNPMWGRKHSEKTRALISAKNKGKRYSEEERKKFSERCTQKKAVEMLDVKTGTVIKRFESREKAAAYVTGNPQNIGFACRHTDRTYKGYKWRDAK